MAAYQPIAVPRIPANLDVTVNLAETFLEPGRYAQHRGLARTYAHGLFLMTAPVWP